MSTKASSFGRDPGLQARMLITLLLLGGLYLVFVLALMAAGAGAVTMAVVLGAVAAAQLLFSDRLALRAVNARITTPEQAPDLHAVIERLCVQADLPKPRVAIADTPVPNAFALGRSQGSAVVCATTGLLRTLQPHELEAVMAHELSHVRNRDVLVMTLASFFASVAAMMTQFGLFFGAGRDRDGGAPAFAIVLLVSFVVYVVSFFLMLALSRYREFAADRGAAIITGQPSALASALMTLDGTMRRIPDRDLRAVGQMNAFFIVPAGAKGALRTLVSTHPPLEQRIDRLQRLERQLQHSV
ncbi:MAG TPA: zinc metalloprotease HtpX [Solirubrobacteraceae bacterium]|nr:zinc metalloprotease HtpX [Solirubrobacteraceae bacterium]